PRSARWTDPVGDGASGQDRPPHVGRHPGSRAHAARASEGAPQVMSRDLLFVLNHIWQSTLVAGVAWLACALLLRHNSPRIRYGVWLTASLKFLIPFAVFVD